MADAKEAPKDGADLHALARDWITIVQSELAGIAADREVAEGFSLILGLWAAATTSMLSAMPRGPMPKDAMSKDAMSKDWGRDGAAAAPRAAPVAAASDPRDAEIRDLARRVAELELRLSAAGAGEPGPRTARKPRRKPG